MGRFVPVAILAVILVGCGGHPATPTPPPGVPPAILRAYPAARWLPSGPTYALASPTVRAWQAGVGDLLDTVGALVELDRARASEVLRAVIGVDALSPDALAQLGIDIDGGLALYATRADPTLVVRVAAPDRLAAYIDQARARGMRTQSVIVDGAEVLTADTVGGIRISWALADGWLWVHVARPGSPETGTEWLQASRHPGAPAWVRTWPWSDGAAPPAIAGVGDGVALVRGMLGNAAQCLERFAAVGPASFAVEAARDRAAVRFAVELAPPAAASVAAAVRAPPGGWDTVAQRAPLAAQWNVDLDTTRAWLAPCLTALGPELGKLDTLGVRTARVIVERFDPDAKTKSRGVVSADLAHDRFFAAQLAEIPLRSTLERRRTFGPYTGASISIPFGPTVEYVLTDKVAIAGLGEGMVSSVTTGTVTAPVLAALDLAPPAMPAAAWTALAEMIGLPASVIDHMVRWRHGRATVALDGNRLVLEATGERIVVGSGP